MTEQNKPPAPKPNHPDPATFKGTYKDYLGDLKGTARSIARRAWRKEHGANVTEVK